jgi:hypothetical protein
MVKNVIHDENFSSDQTLFVLLISESFGACPTQNGGQGQCIYLRSCNDLFQILINPQITLSDRLYLARSQCGYRERQPLVCSATIQLYFK